MANSLEGVQDIYNGLRDELTKNKEFLEHLAAIVKKMNVAKDRISKNKG